jgi:hypothetical protein
LAVGVASFEGGRPLDFRGLSAGMVAFCSAGKERQILSICFHRSVQAAKMLNHH